MRTKFLGYKCETCQEPTTNFETIIWVKKKIESIPTCWSCKGRLTPVFEERANVNSRQLECQLRI